MNKNVKIAKELVKLAQELVAYKPSKNLTDKNAQQMGTKDYMEIDFSYIETFLKSNGIAVNDQNMRKYIKTNYKGFPFKKNDKSNKFIVCKNDEIYRKIFGDSKPTTMWEDNVNYNLNSNKTLVELEDIIIDYLNNFDNLRNKVASTIKGNISDIKQQLIPLLQNDSSLNSNANDLIKNLQQLSAIQNDKNYEWNDDLRNQLNPDHSQQFGNMLNKIEREANILGVLKLFVGQVVKQCQSGILSNNQWLIIQHKFHDNITRTIRMKVGKNPSDTNVIKATVKNALANQLLQNKKNFESLINGVKKIHFYITELVEEKEMLRAFTETNNEYVQKLLISAEQSEDILKQRKSNKTAGTISFIKSLFNKINTAIKNIYTKGMTILKNILNKQNIIKNETENILKTNNEINNNIENSFDQILKEIQSI